MESAIQRALVSYLKTISSRSSPIKVIATLNEDSRHKLDMGVDVGCADLILCRRIENILLMLFLELKRKTGTLQKSQLDWGVDFDENFAAINATRAIAYGYDQAIQLIDTWIKSTDAAFCCCASDKDRA